MVRDGALLQAARAQRERVDVLQDEAERERALYHQAIRRLHAAGASMREIADELGLSHQRVHQIVNGGPGMPTSTRKPGLLQRLVGHRSAADCKPLQKGVGLADDLGGRFFVDARDAMALAAKEAETRGDDYIGTEHILLGLLAAEHGLAARLLISIRANSADLHTSVDRIVGKGPGPSQPGPRRLVPRAKKVLELARREATTLGSTHVRSEHLLLAIAREGEGVGAKLLHDLGVRYEQLRRRVDRASLVCSFCNRSGFDVAHLISGPGIFICERCVRDASDPAIPAETRSTSGLRDAVGAAASDLGCCFCGKTRADAGRLVIARPPAAICEACLVICSEICDEQLG